MPTDDRFHRPYRVRIPREVLVRVMPYATAMRYTMPHLVTSLLLRWAKDMQKNPQCLAELAQMKRVLESGIDEPNDGDSFLAAHTYRKPLLTPPPPEKFVGWAEEEMARILEERGNSPPDPE